MPGRLEPRGDAARQPRETASAGDRCVCLNSFRSAQVEQIDHPLDGGPAERRVALGAVHQPDEGGLVADDEGRYAPDLVLLDGLGVLGLDDAEGLARWPARRTRRRRRRRWRPARHAGGPRSRSDSPSSWRMANSARWTAGNRSGNQSRTSAPDLEGEQPAVALGLVPDVGLAVLDVDLAEGEGDEAHVPVGSVGQAGEHVLVGVAGERAAVVPGDGEAQHGPYNPATTPAIPASRHLTVSRQGRPGSEAISPMAAADGRADDDVRGVVHPHVAPAQAARRRPARARAGRGGVGACRAARRRRPRRWRGRSGSCWCSGCG